MPVLGSIHGVVPCSGKLGVPRVDSHVNSHSMDILVVPWVPKNPVCLAYDFMRAVGHMQGLQDLFSHFYDFLDFF